VETEVTRAARVAEFIFDHGQATVERPSDVRAWLRGLT
jgi:malate dehydrogenase (oxaloacetate-decarboxylating)(NADP+)